MAVLIIGAGGHGKVVADILQLQNIAILGFLDDDSTLWGSMSFGLPVLGGIDQYTAHEVAGVAMGVGSNRARKAIVERYPALRWINAVHPSATIAQSASLGSGVMIAPHAVIAPDTTIGSYTIINTAATIDHDCIIGDFAHVAPGSHLAGNVAVGAGVLLGVGTNVTPGCNIGDWSIVGAGSTVVRDIPANVIAKGIPARWEGS
jgi:acetyltransferase EpsM